MSTNKITGSNIYGYTIIPTGYEISQPNGKSKFLQNVPLDGIDADEWKKEEVRIKAAEAKVLSLNSDLLDAARFNAKCRVRDLYERSTFLPLDDKDTNAKWDATATSAVELICAQVVCQNSNMPIVLFDANNKEHKFNNPIDGKAGELKLVPIISKIAFSAMEKMKKKNSIYAALSDMYDIDELLKFNPYSDFGLTKSQADSLTAIKAYY